MTQPLIHTHKLSCERDERMLFTDLELTLHAGEAIHLAGSNGSGKTTLLRILADLNHDFTGEFSWQGKLVQHSPMAHEDYRLNMFYLGHSPGISRALTPLQNLTWFCALQGIDSENEEQILEVLRIQGLAGYENLPCYQLSAGQQRRVSLARLFLTNARLWLLDEPFTALDKQAVKELEAKVSTFVRGGGSVVLTTHHELRLDCPLRELNLDHPAQTLHEFAEEGR